MIRINQLKLPVDHKPEDIKKKAAKALRISPDQVEELVIRRRSLDARKKPELFYIYTVDIKTAKEEQYYIGQKIRRFLSAEKKHISFQVLEEGLLLTVR